MTPRGVRNLNPGNLEKGATRWQGMAAEQMDSRFVVFTSPVYGFRALAKTLLTYQRKYGLRTIEDMIGRWAPPVENNTAAYVAAVATACGVDPHAPVSLKDSPALLRDMLRAICVHENGYCPWGDEVIEAGIVAV